MMERKIAIVSVALFGAGFVLACGTDEEPFNPYPGYRSQVYADASMWLCAPGIAGDRCGDDLTATEFLADGGAQVLPHWPATDPAYDCFYVYPTMDFSEEAGNNDLAQPELFLDPLYSQAARFSGQCRVFAPLYHQATLGAFMSEESATYLAIAYADVEDAFWHYLAQWSQGRDFVLLGHSQGSMHLVELLRRELDAEPRLRERLIMAIVPGAAVYTREGESRGGVFQEIPLCTRAGERGCVVAFNSFAADFPPTSMTGWLEAMPEGMSQACVNPAQLASADGVFSASYFPAQTAFGPLPFPGPPQTPFVLYREFYSGECRRSDAGFRYLAISVHDEPSDLRNNVLPFELLSAIADYIGWDVEAGLHLLDYNFSTGDLLDLVSRSAAQ